MKFQAGDLVEIRNMPWRGVLGTYVRRAGLMARVFGMGHIVEVGDLISGGTPRRVRVGKVRPWHSS
jgi:hypothetical protein